MALPRLPDKRATTELVADLIRQAIFEGILKPGEHLREERIAAETGVSRAPVREAFLKLEGEGLLVREPYRGAKVATVSRDDLYELFVLREHLESLAVKLAAPIITAEDLVALKRIVEAKKRYQGPDDTEQERLNQEFHALIHERCPIGRLTVLLKQLWAQFPKSMWRLRRYRIQENIEEFEGVIGALEASEPDAAAAWMQRHVSRGAQSILDIYDAHQRGLADQRAHVSAARSAGGEPR